MNKQQLCERVSKQTKTPKSKVMSIIDSAFSQISGTLKKGDDFKMVGFGSWKVIKRKARMGKNPQTGEAMKIKAKKIAKFRMSQNLSEMLN